MAVVVAVAGAAEIVTEGLWHILRQDPDLEILEGYAPDRVALDQPPPDVVVYDVIAMQHDDGAALEELIRSHQAPVVAVGRELRPDLAARAMRSGAHGFVSLEAPACEVLSVIRAAAGGETNVSGAPGLGDEVSLTCREAEILADVVRGYSNREVAERQSISVNTVKSYIRLTYRKIDVRTRAQAVSWGIRHGFQPCDEHAKDPAWRVPDATRR
jgi:NarL family two-component system response regulator LiaR